VETKYAFVQSVGSLDLSQGYSWRKSREERLLMERTKR